ncbi:MAG TPA: nitrogen fixation protein [Candidatus Angelobacter sp.]|jgi:hypothetical protein
MTEDKIGENATPRRETTRFCPSAQPSLGNSMVLGTVNRLGAEPSVTLLEHPVKVTEGTILAFAGGQVRPTDVFRFAAPCEQCGCHNWSGSSCRVAERLVQILPASGSDLPRCKLRPVCQWFAQEGGAACARCPQVRTDDASLEAALNSVAPASIPLATKISISESALAGKP